MRLILTAMLLAVIATSLMGVGVIIVVSMPGYTSKMVMLAAGAGLLLSFPAAWLVSSSILKNIKN